MEKIDRMSPDEFWRHLEFTVEGVRRAADQLPLFKLASWGGPVMLGDWEWENDVLTHAGLVHGTPESDVRVEVNTTVKDVRREAARIIGRAIGLKPGRHTDYKQRRKEIHEEPGSEVVVAVDDAAVSFTMWGGDTRWWAAGHVGAVGVTIDARNYPHETLALTTADTIDDYVNGWRSYVRTHRGE